MDALSLSVACASILAKDWRDSVMAELDERHPGYGFRSNKGTAGMADHRTGARSTRLARHRSIA
ncbi:MAG: hypothetical protein HND48_05470 [Chloroflexi bacterium]|nr:hypothetical protein [Chloroflexota bacterium]